MTSEFSVNMNEYLPLRDVVFNTLASGNPQRRAEAGRETDGDCPCRETLE